MKLKHVERLGREALQRYRAGDMSRGELSGYAQGLADAYVALGVEESEVLGDLKELTETLDKHERKTPPGYFPLPEPKEGFDLEKYLEEVERQILEKALKRTKGNKTAATQLLGVNFRSLRYRLSKLNIDDAEG